MFQNLSGIPWSVSQKFLDFLSNSYCFHVIPSPVTRLSEVVRRSLRGRSEGGDITFPANIVSNLHEVPRFTYKLMLFFYLIVKKALSP